jgi:hypothetical protein
MLDAIQVIFKPTSFLSAHAGSHTALVLRLEGDLVRSFSLSWKKDQQNKFQSIVGQYFVIYNTIGL